MKFIAKVLAVVILGTGVGVVLDVISAPPPPAEAATYIGNYWGYNVHCSSPLITVARPTGSLRKYCTKAYYHYYVRSADNTDCHIIRATGKAWLHTWGLQFDRTGTVFVSRCSGPA